MTEFGTRITDQIKYYKSRMNGMATEMMMGETQYAYINMARGGDGNHDGCNPGLREDYYKGEKDRFFQLVSEGMGWNWKK